jgi:hypothetical protein
MTRCGRETFGSGRGPVASSYEHENVLYGSITGGKFIEELSDYQFLRTFVHGDSKLIW